MNVSCPSCETIYRIDPARVIGDQVRARCKVCSGIFDVAPEVSTVATVAPAPERATSPQFRTVPPVQPEWHADPAPQPVAPPPITATPQPVVAPIAPTAPRETPPRPMAPRLSRPITPSWSLPDPVQDPTPPAPPPAPEAVTDAPTPPMPEAPARPSAPVFRPNVGAPMPAPPVPDLVRTAPRIAPVVEPPSPEPEMVSPPVPPAPQVTPEPASPKARPINPFLNRDPKAKARRLARALVSDMIVYQPEKRQQALEQGNIKEAFEEEIKKSWQEFVEQVGDEMADSTSFFNDALNEILAGGEKIF